MESVRGEFVSEFFCVCEFELFFIFFFILSLFVQFIGFAAFPSSRWHS
jgi:hypothetical protein